MYYAAVVYYYIYFSLSRSQCTSFYVIPPDVACRKFESLKDC